VAAQRSFVYRDKLSVDDPPNGFCVKALSVLGLLAAVSATANAGGITLGTPLISGDFSTFERRQRTFHRDLSAEELRALSHWLEQHRSGWQGMITPATSEPVQTEVDLKHSDGGTTSVCVIARADGGYYLRLTGPGTWAYRSFGGIFKSWAATRSMSAEELAQLLSLVSSVQMPSH
jgi:hypothetical protein